ncbi:hypothetical protein M3Y99_00664600 [Aphelenchoides fujianensis]|nr:hypothetical protein M3Y99_00664600 [Aphelenchoides fujianensis]
MPPKESVFVVGVGMTAFTKPGPNARDYPELVREAVEEALADCGLKYPDVEQAAVGFMYGGTCCGQRGALRAGIDRNSDLQRNADVFLAVGFEKMRPGSMDAMLPNIDGRATSKDRHLALVEERFGPSDAPSNPRLFGAAGLEHMRKYGTKREHFAKIGYKNHLHSVHNPKSQFQKKYSLEDVLKARPVYGPLGLLECSPTSDGAAAAVLVSARFLRRHPALRDQAVEILGMELTTDEASVFAEGSAIKATGFDMAQKGAKALFSKAGFTPNDVQVIELHDCFATNELITYEALGLCPVGKAGELIDRGDNTYGGRWVINPSGGLISKGHPIGATGVAQCVELCNQLRGRCGKRQVPNVRVALQHNLGIGGACVVALYRRADLQQSEQTPNAKL